MQCIFLVGAKSLGAYGGYETFIDKLTEYHQHDEDIKYYVATKANGQGACVPQNVEWNRTIMNRYTYHNAEVFQIDVPEWLGSAQAIYYDCKSLSRCIEIIKKEKIAHPIVYIMACRIGPFFKYYVNRIHKLNGKVFLNPDGHEWKRAKWSIAVRKYWKKSEDLMVRQSDLIVCDSKNIEKYVIDTYNVKNTVYIAYGAETRKSNCSNEEYEEWLLKNDIKDRAYYLVVGRFVPENNYETMIREFMKSNTKKDFVIVTNVNDDFLRTLEKLLNYKKDKRIKFVGTVYNRELLKKIRERAYGYFHGHEVGGTNPSLLEALGSTKLNLLLDVAFNREVGGDGAVYWKKDNGDLSRLIDEVDNYDEKTIDKYGEKAKNIIIDKYSWGYIAEKYRKIFTN